LWRGRKKEEGRRKKEAARLETATFFKRGRRSNLLRNASAVWRSTIREGGGGEREGRDENGLENVFFSRRRLPS